MVSEPPRWAWEGLGTKPRSCLRNPPSTQELSLRAPDPQTPKLHSGETGIRDTTLCSSSWGEFRDSSICDRAGDEPFPHPNFPAGTSSHRVWVFLCCCGVPEIGARSFIREGILLFSGSWRSLEDSSALQRENFLFSPVLIARAGGNKKAALSDLPIFRSY